jgi:hypothetical protein
LAQARQQALALAQPQANAEVLRQVLAQQMAIPKLALIAEALGRMRYVLRQLAQAFLFQASQTPAFFAAQAIHAIQLVLLHPAAQSARANA